MTVFVAISSGTFLLALNYTSVANVLFMQAASPMMAALLGWVFLSERIDARTWVALLLAGAGVVLMAAGSLDSGAAAVALPFVMTASFAAVIVIARHRREVSMMPATCASQVLVVVVCAPLVSLGSLGTGDVWILAALGVGQMGLGLALLTIGARLIPPAQVAVLSLIEVVLGPLWVWLAYGERPSATTFVGGGGRRRRGRRAGSRRPFPRPPARRRSPRGARLIRLGGLFRAGEGRARRCGRCGRVQALGRVRVAAGGRGRVRAAVF